MPLIINEKTNEVKLTLDRKYISKEETKKMFPDRPKCPKCGIDHLHFSMYSCTGEY